MSSEDPQIKGQVSYRPGQLSAEPVSYRPNRSVIGRTLLAKCVNTTHQIDRAPLVAVVLLETVQERPHLLLPQHRSTRHPALPAQTCDSADIFLLRALAQRFELDETDEGE